MGEERGMTFDEIITVETELERLKSEAVTYMNNGPSGYQERSRYWYRELKPRFKELVGFMAEKPELRTCEAYDTAYMGFMEILKI